MRKIVIAFFAVFAFSLGTQQAHAQWFTELTYGPGFATREFNEFAPSTGWWNWQFQARKIINNRFEVGGAIGWNYFEHDFGRTTVTGDGFALTANVRSYTNMFNFMLVNQYNLIEKGEAIPFVRLGLGMGHQNQEQEVGLYVVGDNSWQFVLNPEVGVRFELNHYLGAVLAGGYTFMPEAGGVLPTSFWTLKLGLSWLQF